MEQGRVTETERMLSLVVGYTELVGGKGKSGKGFSKPNFEPGPKLDVCKLGALSTPHPGGGDIAYL
jgi:hypothetical protein